MPSTIKFSQFVAGGSLVAGDQVAGLRNNANTLFDWSGGGGSGAGASIEVTQANHGFAVGQALRLNGSVYALAQADSAENAEAVGLVTIADPLTPDVFTIQQIGPVSGLTNLVAGDVYFLSESSPGDLTTIEPSVSGEISKPMFIAATTTSGFILSMRGQVVTSVPDSPEVQIENILQRTINQNGHGLDLGHWVRLSGASYVKAIGTTQANAEVVGQVIEVIDVDNFVLQTAGYVSGSVAALTAGTVYYLSTTDLGEMTATEPTAVGEFTRPVFIATGATAGYILEQRSLEIESSGGGGGGEALTKTISQANTFVDPTDLGKLLRIDNVSGDYVFAQADSFVNSLVVGMLINIIDANTFVIQTAGYVPDTPAVVSTLNVGELYYLSPTALGGMTSTAPVTDGQVSRPVFMPDAADSGYLLEQRSLTLPFGSTGGGSGNWVQIATETAASSATVDLENVFSATYTRYMIIGYNLTFQTGGSHFALRVGTGATPTWKSGASDYAYAVNYGTSGAGVFCSGSTAADFIKLAHNIGASANQPSTMLLYIDDPLNASFKKTFQSQNSSTQNASAISNQTSTSVGVYLTAEAISSLRFLMSSGNIVTGTFEVYGFNPNGGGSGGGIASNVVQSFITMTATSTAYSGDIAGISCVITPSSATSRVRLKFTSQAGVSTSGSVLIKRNGSFVTDGAPSIRVGMSFWGGDYIDSPSTTLPVTYTVFAGDPTTGAAESGVFRKGIVNLIAEEIGPA